MKTLVTGASGHLGANLVRRLLEDGHNVRVLLRQGSNNTAVDNLQVERSYGDLRDFDSTLAAVEGCDRIYHCAAKVSTLDGDAHFHQEIYDSNVLGTIHLLRAALNAKVTKVVVTGSFSAVGHHPSHPSDETIPFYPFGKHLPYEVSKAFMEQECLKAYADGLDVVIAVSCAILGPNDFKPSRMGKTLIDFAHGKIPAYVGGGFDFVAAKDIVAGHILAMEKGRGGQKYIFSSQFLTIDEIMAIFEEVTGVAKPKLCLPSKVMAGVAGIADFIYPRFFPKAPRRFTSGAVRILQMHRHADTNKAQIELGYQPTSVKQAIYEAYQDFVRRGLIVKADKERGTGNREQVMGNS
ncbi:NAD-dependent epimerase/dehydratase family protein [Nostoc sp. CENA67]|uniref:NAD-dependent epimerase/dehydratase family protein n=1 Tax=Amazonocrinis nigriterrae CENA67 TaxID=2794033 RepID=A0A8J7HMC4_9NOST|nr:NAD-dependent epimerase/dehydratase family protein [Amazonocrinis nigriterrae]MBH8561912.1 NAD-dependent epimerase/dehydratase family protein [Amazonocrinis nigriterrae CENA67]